MSREISMPLSVDAQGRIASSNDPLENTRHHLLSYLMTSPGERVMRPSFGTQLGNYVFEALDPVQYELLTAGVVDKVGRDVPDARLLSVTPRADYEEASLRVAVEFATAVGIGQGVAQTATLNLGGTA